MGEPNDRQPATTEERRSHDDARFAHREEALVWEKEAQMRKYKIMGALVIVGGALIWAWTALR